MTPADAVDRQARFYATHREALDRLFATYKIETVLETGSGKYSTHDFLSRDSVKRLVSLENDPAWVIDTGDTRHEVREVNGLMADALPADLERFDLVFIDDDPLEDRVHTIRAVLGRARRFVAVHDVERDCIHEAIEAVWPCARDETTAVFWNPAGMRKAQI